MKDNTGLFEMIFGVLTTCHTLEIIVYIFYLIEQHFFVFVTYLTDALYCTLRDSTGLFEMIVGVLTTCHTQHT